MASIKIISRRIKSAQNIAQITRAMEMVAASKMKKAQEAALLGKPYAERIYQAVRELAQRTEKRYHPLLSLGNVSGKVMVVLISTNKGLCGGLNTNLFRMLHHWLGKDKSADFVTIGKKGENFAVRSGKNLIADFSDKTPFANNVPPLIKLITDGFIKGSYKEIYLAYNTFLTALQQIPVKKLLLPLSSFESVNVEEMKFHEFLIEPGIDDILSNLLPHYLENQVRTAIYEGEASEHSARMIAMKNATDSALDLMDDLTLIYNKARQEKITYEIADMVTARMAVE